MTWQLFITLRIGEMQTRELDATPLLGCTLIIAVVALIVRTGL